MARLAAISTGLGFAPVAKALATNMEKPAMKDDKMAKPTGGMMDKTDERPSNKMTKQRLQHRAHLAGPALFGKLCGMASVETATGPGVLVIHPRWVRLTHWINAAAMIVMIASGWEIYNASPLFAFTFSKSITLGGWLAGALLLHFAAMWVLAVNGLVYLALGFATGRFRRKFWPIRPSEVLADTKAALTFSLSHDDLTVYNAVQRLLYVGVIVAGVVVVLSGLAMWKPVQLQELTAFFGGYEASRYVHFFAMAAIVGFLVIHVVLAIVVPKSLRAIVVGR